MQVVKRDGRREAVAFDKITRRLEHLARGVQPSLRVDVVRVAGAVCAAVRDGITTVRLDELAADTAAGFSTDHPDYSALAARVLVSNLHKHTSDSVVGTFERLADQLAPEFLAAARAHGPELQAMVRYESDYDFDFFGFKTMEKMYLARASDGAVAERPQHMWLRVALALWGWGPRADLARVRDTYDRLRRREFTHASPTLFNAGMRNNNLASCFLMMVPDDSVEGIFDAFAKCAQVRGRGAGLGAGARVCTDRFPPVARPRAQVSKFGGGIGLSVSNVRSRGARIRGTNGASDGLMPLLRVANAVAGYINQGSRRKGSIAVYLQPHHPDLPEFLAAKRNAGDEHLRARDLFYALWVPDLFMRRVEAGGAWSFFDPDACPGLDECWGAEYDALYARYEAEGRAARTVPAQDLWHEVCKSQTETGTPYLLYKDAANAKSNQRHLGALRCSNLCAEILEYVAPDEVAVCTLASVCLPTFVVDGALDLAALAAATRAVARNLDRVVDVCMYPVPEARRSNLRHRPVGIGVQGLHDVFMHLGLPFDSPEAAAVSRDVAETMYHAAVSESAQLAREFGRHESFAGSPASHGLLQCDLWGVAPRTPLAWDTLRADVREHGLRNSLSIAYMPTASTASIFGNVEGAEPLTSNVYSRRTLAGEFAVVNRHLVRALESRGLWTEAVRGAVLARGGSVQGVPGVPPDVQRVFRTAWELSMRAVIDLAADRGPFVCQSQSMNLFVAEPSARKLSSMHFHAWRAGLKTGVYYLRTQPAARALAVTLPAAAPAAAPAAEPCEEFTEEECLFCSA